MMYRAKVLREVMVDVEANSLPEAVAETLKDLAVIEVLRISRVKTLVTEAVNDGVTAGTT